MEKIKKALESVNPAIILIAFIIQLVGIGIGAGIVISDVNHNTKVIEGVEEKQDAHFLKHYQLNKDLGGILQAQKEMHEDLKMIKEKLINE